MLKVVALLLFPSLVVADGLRTTGDLRLACKAFLELEDGNYANEALIHDALLCSAYVSGVTDILYLGRSAGLKFQFRACIPEGASTYEVARRFVNLTNKNPDKLNRVRAYGLLRALRTTWPCRKPDQKVQQVQVMLISLGYSPGSPDGRMGKKTEAAIREFQGDRGIPVDGEVSTELHDQILQAAGEKGMIWRLEE